MDAYDLKNKLLELWQPLAITESGAGIKRYAPEVPVYVETDQGLKEVVDIVSIDNKITLKIK
jgi:hypothetical protein